MLKEARLSLGLGLKEAGQPTGLHFQTISAWENGQGGSTGDSRAMMLRYIKWLQEYAVANDYGVEQFHESVICPGEFPKPATPSSSVSGTGQDGAAGRHSPAAPSAITTKAFPEVPAGDGAANSKRPASSPPTPSVHHNSAEQEASPAYSAPCLPTSTGGDRSLAAAGSPPASEVE